ncbi:MAG TPA: hypothetical protein VE758_03155 [Chthoniobacterales bacterium]|nr:hypothetical protein [Chthoniobacterales bacterium]
MELNRGQRLWPGKSILQKARAPAVILSEVEGSDELSADHQYFVYMMSNKTRSVLYTGVTTTCVRA